MEGFGTRAENFIAKVVAEPLLVDFIHLRPYFMHKQGPRELCDLLIEDESDAIVVQLKTRDPQAPGSTRHPQKWAAKQIMTASRQAKGAVRNLGRVNIHCKHAWREDVVFNAGSLHPKHAIVLVEDQDPLLPISSNLPRRVHGNVPVHYLAINDFLELCNELMTLPDFVRYLNERSLIPAWATPPIGVERDVYAHFLTHGGRFESITNASDFKGEWVRLTGEHADKYAEKKKADASTAPYNEMLKKIRIIDPKMSEYTPGYVHRSSRDLEEGALTIARLLNRVPLIQRRSIVERMREKLLLADSSEKGFNFFATQLDSNNRWLVFVASRKDRTDRIKLMQGLCYSIIIKMHSKTAVGVATENMNFADGRSFDWTLLDYAETPNDPATEAELDKIFGDLIPMQLFDFPHEARRIVLPFD